MTRGGGGGGGEGGGGRGREGGGGGGGGEGGGGGRTVLHLLTQESAKRPFKIISIFYLGGNPLSLNFKVLTNAFSVEVDQGIGDWKDLWHQPNIALQN